MGCAAIFLYSNTIDFMNATVVTTVDTMTVPLSEVFFPSVVVCNINQVNIFLVLLSVLYFNKLKVYLRGGLSFPAALCVIKIGKENYCKKNVCRILI